MRNILISILFCCLYLITSGEEIEKVFLKLDKDYVLSSEDISEFGFEIVYHKQKFNIYTLQPTYEDYDLIQLEQKLKEEFPVIVMQVDCKRENLKSVQISDGNCFEDTRDTTGILVDDVREYIEYAQQWSNDIASTSEGIEMNRILEITGSSLGYTNTFLELAALDIPENTTVLEYVGDGVKLVHLAYLGIKLLQQDISEEERKELSIDFIKLGITTATSKAFAIARMSPIMNILTAYSFATWTLYESYIDYDEDCDQFYWEITHMVNQGAFVGYCDETIDKIGGTGCGFASGIGLESYHYQWATIDGVPKYFRFNLYYSENRDEWYLAYDMDIDFADDGFFGILSANDVDYIVVDAVFHQIEPLNPVIEPITVWHEDWHGIQSHNPIGYIKIPNSYIQYLAGNSMQLRFHLINKYNGEYYDITPTYTPNLVYVPLKDDIPVAKEKPTIEFSEAREQIDVYVDSYILEGKVYLENSVCGKELNTITLKVNEQNELPIALNENNEFSISVSLETGLNQVVVKAVDNLDYQSEKILLINNRSSENPRQFMFGEVDKLIGTTSDNFTFTVDYLDLTGNDPVEVKVNVGESTFLLDKIEGTVSSGATYQKNVKIDTEGEYDFNFSGKDYLGTVIDTFFPSVGQDIIEVAFDSLLIDSLALVEFYNLTDGPYWNNNENWLSGPIMSWYGITLGDIGYGQRVTEINLIENSLSGQIPESINDLKYLELLDLHNNNLIGDIPSTVGQLNNLHTLDFSYNNLSDSIPIELGQLKNLVSLELHANHISGTIPSELFHMVNLEHLDLGANNLIGPIPTNIDNCIKLKSIDLGGGNNLTGVIPDELCHLSNLETLRLRGNTHTGNIPANIWQMSSLKSLDLGYNSLIDSLPPEIGSLKQIADMYLMGNQLSGKIPEELYSLETLVNLNLSENQFSGDISTKIGLLSNLWYLNIRMNQFSGTIPMEIGQLQNLYTLIINNNYFTGNLPTSLCSTPISFVSFSNNGFDIESCPTISCMKDNNVRFSDSDQLQYSGFSLLNNCDSSFYYSIESDSLALVALYNSTDGENWLNNDNWLEGPIDNWYGVEVTPWYNGLGRRVTNIYLSNNNLNGELPLEIGYLNQVYNFQLSSNNLHGSVPKEIGDMDGLGLLDLSFNFFSDSIPELLKNTDDLYGIYGILLDNNNFIGNIPDRLTEFPNLNILSVRNNSIENIPNFSNLSYLQYLNCEGNKLTFEDIEPNVNVASTFTYSPQDSIGQRFDTVIIEQDSFIYVLNIGGGNNKYEWYKDGVILPNQISDTLLCENLSKQDEGEYTCIINNSVVTDLTLYSRPIHITVIEQLRDSISISSLSPQSPSTLFEGDKVLVEFDYTTTNEGVIFNAYPVSSNVPQNYHLTCPSQLLYQQYGSGITCLGLDTVGTIDSIHFQFTDTTNQNILYEKSYPLQYNFISDSLRSSLFADSLALVALYNSTDGDNWNNNTNWMIGTVYSWYGITIEDGRVSQVSLSNNNLQGVLPPEIGDLSQLKILYLYNNQLTGELPDSLWKLDELTELHLSSNQFNGSISSQIANLTQLKKLFLHNNQFSGNIPQEIGNLLNLQYLYLSGNQLTGQLPESIGNLTSLLQLYIGDNDFTGSIPTSYESLTNMFSIYLSNNHFSGSFPASILNMKDLVGLGLANNDFYGALPSNIGNELTKLKYFYIEGNYFSDSIPQSLSTLQYLTTFTLQDNEFEYLPDFSSISTLSKLHCHNNRLDFGDLEPNWGISDFSYNPQDSVGSCVDTTLLANQYYSYNLDVNGNNNLYQWYKDDSILPTQNTNTLNLENIQLADSGIYHCVITNSTVTGLSLYSRPLKITINEQYCFNQSFKAGWNIFSIPITLDSADIGFNFYPLIQNNSLIKIQDEEGWAFEDWGELGNWHNDIGDLIPSEGYKVKLFQNDSLEICGKSLKYPFAIPLDSNWNIIGYPQIQVVDALDIVQSLINRGSLIKVQDERGNSIENLGIYGDWQNFIGNMVSGEGYKVKVNTPDTLWINESYPKSLAVVEAPKTTQHFKTGIPGNGVDHMNFNLVELPVEDLSVDDELALFDGTICVGAMVITGDHLNNRIISIPASASDDLGKPGFKEGNNYNLRVWNAAENTDLEIEGLHISGPVQFTKHESVILSLKNSLVTDVNGIMEISDSDVKCYPNPFSDEINIELDLRKSAEVEIFVLNHLGQKVKFLQKSKLIENGIHRLIWNGQNDSGGTVSPGIYFLQIGINGSTVFKKMVLMK